MPERRVFRFGVLVAGVVSGSLLLTASPRGQQLAQVRGRGAQVQAPQVPTVTVPQIKAPDAAVVQTVPAWSNQKRIAGLVRASQLGLNYIPGEVLVKFKDGVGAAETNRALQAAGTSETSDTVEWVGELAVVRDSTQPNAYVLADQMKSQPEVEFAEPNFIAYIRPSERVRGAQPPAAAPNTWWGARARTAASAAGTPTDADYAAYQWNFQLINMPGAWDIQAGGSGDIIVAVLDSGITGTSGTMTYPVWTGASFQTVAMPYGVNPDLPANRHISAKDYVGPKVPGSPHVDTDGHGTHVSGTIGETTNNATLVSGVAYNVRIMPIKVCSSFWDRMIFRAQQNIPGIDGNLDTSCSFADIVAGINYAVDSGARVLNISLAGPDPSVSIQNALSSAASRGAFIAIAMGNEFEDGNPTMYPAAYASAIDGVMAVASVGPNSTKAYYSSTGAHCEISAPGGHSIGNNGRVDKGVIWQSTLIEADLASFSPRFDRYDKQAYEGTSMATPHVAGLAALIMSQMPLVRGAQVEMILRKSAKDLGATGRDNSFGYGLIQPRAALFGYGISR